IAVVGNDGTTVDMREREQNKVASKELIEIIKKRDADEGVTFEYGETEQKLFRYLNEYGEITVDRFDGFSGIGRAKASAILVNLVSAGILNLFRKDDIDYFTYSQKCENED